MRLTCPRCGSTWELDVRDMPAAGAAVQCSHCSLVWRSAGPRRVSIPGVEAPAEFLELLASRPQDPGVWKVLEDWLLERRLGVGLNTAHLLQTETGVTVHTHRRCGLAARGTVSTLDCRPPPRGELAAMFEHREMAVLHDLRVCASWPSVPAIIDGARPPDPRRVIPGLLEQVLAFAPPRLASLAVWLDPNPGWGPTDDCLSQLEPLTRLRPSSATHLELRAPTRGLLKLLRPVARQGWQTLRVRAPFSVEELGSLGELAAATPSVDFQLVSMHGEPPGLGARNLRWVDDSERMTVSAERAGRQWDLEANAARMPWELASLLTTVGLELRGDLGLWEFDRGNKITRRDHVTVNGVEVLKPMPVRTGERYQVEFQPARGPSISECLTFRQTATPD
ncbi:MAG: zinc-ribbon domain-containing protein [Myxococcaceae bacterium]|jgi:predicted Zn finger-like uncharacterized protein|nr:zinc-ribbon domain-containing protein [Myxococcaceae bacterium]